MKKRIYMIVILCLMSFCMFSCELTQSKKDIVIVASDVSRKYDANHQTFPYTTQDDVNLDVRYLSLKTNTYLAHPPTEVGKYKVEISYQGDDKYNAFYKSFTLEIEKIDYLIDAKNMYLTYSGNPIAFVYESNEVEYSIKYSKLDDDNYSLNIPKEVGNYKVKIITNENDRYKANEKMFYLTIGFDNTFKDIDNQEYEYTGENIEFTTPYEDAAITYYQDSKEVLPKKTGVYDVEVVIALNDKLTYSFYSLTIKKISPVISSLNQEVAYTGSPISFSADLSIEGVIDYLYSIKDQNEYTSTAPTDVGIYDVKCEYKGNDIYNSVTEKFTLEIVDENENVYESSAMNYNENTNIILNPEKGFYQSLEYKLTEKKTTAIWTKEAISNYAKDYSLFHLRFGLESFSSNAGGKDMDIPANTLDCLSATLNVFRSVNATVIIRFSYNVMGTKINGNYMNAEPDLELVLKHIKELSEVINEYKDVICSVETGMLGPWGEQHSTILGNSDITNQNTYYKLVDTWLNNLDSSFKVSVRRPLYFLYWLNNKYKLNINTSNMDKFDYSSLNDDTIYRVGCFNDGYLGSSSDLGTYTNRQSEVNWLNMWATHVLFGGEVVADDDTGGIGLYNAVRYLEVEGYKTHTTYLNWAWNYEKVVSVWMKNKYTGTNSLYNNGRSTEYEFVANHLGYNFVLKESFLNKTIKNNILLLKGKIENNGFGNVVNEKKVEVVIKSSTNIYYYTVDMDITKILSKDIYNYDFNINLSTIEDGEYKVYLKISDIHEMERSALRTIRFSNNDEYFDLDLGANYLGTFIK